MMMLLAAETTSLIATAGDLDGSKFWAGVGLAAAIATAAATAISSLTAIWWRFQDRTEAEWSIRLVSRGGNDAMGSRVAAPKVDVVIQNIGDGTAHKVRVSGKFLADEPWTAETERTRHQIHQPMPVLRTGDSFYAIVRAESFDAWDKATIEVSWWPPPTRKTKRWLIFSRQQHKSFPLSAITDAPNDLPEVKDGEHVF